ncbi:MAG: presqualene diphosphate synthase HpnD [Rhodospirillaceae bacterium]|nr:presqualene diphosphate synthase HpnD [Rhodospirillaceae bacterium]
MTMGRDQSPPPASDQVVADITRKSGSSFYWAMRLLPRHKRSAMYAIYAFCRIVDDIADGDDDIEVKNKALRLWKQNIETLFSGTPVEPISEALQVHIHRFGLQQKDFDAVIDGMLMDAVPALKIRDMDELVVYCDRVACAVGRMSVAVFEIEAGIGAELAKSLGLALQLTNILRDVSEDWERDHIYLPADLLRAEGVEPGDLLNPEFNAGLAAVCDHIAEMAALQFKDAERLINSCDRSRVRPALIMKNVYQRLFQRILDRGWGRLHERVALSKFEKSALILKSTLFSH